MNIASRAESAAALEALAPERARMRHVLDLDAGRLRPAGTCTIDRPPRRNPPF